MECIDENYEANDSNMEESSQKSKKKFNMPILSIILSVIGVFTDVIYIGIIFVLIALILASIADEKKLQKGYSKKQKNKAKILSIVVIVLETFWFIYNEATYYYNSRIISLSVSYEGGNKGRCNFR